MSSSIHITLPVAQIVASQSAIATILAEKIPALLAYKLGVVHGKLSSYVMNFEKQREVLIKEYGNCIDEVVGTYEIKDPSAISTVNTELGKLLSTEETFEISAKISLDLLKDVSVTGNTIVTLDWLFE